MAEADGHKKLMSIFLLAIAFTVPLAIYKGTSNQVLLKISLAQLFLLPILITWFHQAIIRGKGLTLIRSPLAWPLYFFFFLSLISLFGSKYRWAGGLEIYRLASYLLLYGVSANVLGDRLNLSRLVFLWLLSTGLASLYGLYQYFFAGMAPPRSTFGNANFFAAYLVLPFPLTIALFISSIFSYRNSKVTPHPRIECGAGFNPLQPPFNKGGNKGGLLKGRVREELRILSLAILLLVMTLSLSLASSRGAWLGLGISFIFLCWLSCIRFNLRRVAARIIPAFVVIILILTAFLSPWLLERGFVKEELEKGTLGLRILIWEGTLRMIVAHPFLGSGLGSFQAAYPQYRIPEYFGNPHAVDSTAHAHNEFLEIAAETGIAGMVAFLWVLTVFFIKGIDIVRKGEDRYKRVLTMGCISGVVGLLITNLFGVNLRFPSSAIFLWLTLGLVMSQYPITGYTLTGTGGLYPYTLIPLYPYGHRRAQAGTGGHRRVTGYKESRVAKLSLPLRRVIFGFALLLAVGAGWQVVAKPFLADMYFQRGINYRKAGDWEGAISGYQKAVELDPYFVKVYYRLGFAYASIGDLNRAISAYEKVIDLAPDFARVQANIAFLYKEKGKLDKAIQAYQRALRLNPHDTKAIHYLKEIYDEIGSGP